MWIFNLVKDIIKQLNCSQLIINEFQTGTACQQRSIPVSITKWSMHKVRTTVFTKKKLYSLYVF